jgi:alpha-L-fucosidase
MTMNTTWGYKSYDDDWKSAEELIRKLIDITSKGGNFLLNVGPTSLGEIPDPSIDRLHAIGDWMDTNSEAIYGTSPSPFRKLQWGRCTRKDNKLYFHIFDWPLDGHIRIPGLNNKVTRAYALDGEKKLKPEHNGREWYLQVSKLDPDPIATVIVVEIEGEPDVDQLYPSNKWDLSIQLNPDMSDIEQHGYGEKMEIIEEDGTEFITNWTTHRANVSWEFMNTQAGRYRIMAKMRSSDLASTELMIQMHLNEERVTPVKLNTLQLGEWSQVVLGEKTIPAGRNTIKLTRRAMMDRNPEIELQSVRLIRVERTP